MKKNTSFISLLIFYASFTSQVSFCQQVGINTDGSMPQQLLHLHESGSTGQGLKITNLSTGNAVTDGFDILQNNSDVLLLQKENASMRFYTNGSEKMTILGNGNVGIGTNAPAVPFHVYHSANTNADKIIFGEHTTFGTFASQVLNYDIQMRLSGVFNLSYNRSAVGAVKLWIGNYDNDGSLVYPIYAEDENNLVDFFIKNGNIGLNIDPVGYFRGYLGIGVVQPTSKLQVNGSFSAPITTVNVNYSPTINDYTILVNANAGNIDISLPTAIGITGRIYVIKKIDNTANTVNIIGNGVQTVDGLNTRGLTVPNDRIMIQSNGTNWYIIN